MVWIDLYAEGVIDLYTLKGDIYHSTPPAPFFTEERRIYLC